MSADGFTAKELRGATGWGETKARRWVTKCIDAGKLTFAGRTMRPKVDGAMAPVPVYQIVKKAKAASRRRVKRG